MESERTVVVTADMLAPALAPAEPKDHYLVGVEGVCAGLRLRLADRALRIGRNASCDIPIADSQVSGRHCELALSPAGSALQVTDLGSTNGTFIDGVRVQGTASLPVGGLLRFGAEVLRHEHVSRAEAAQWEGQRKELDKARHYVESLLPPSLVTRPLSGNAPVIEIAVGYRADNPSPILRYFLENIDRLIASRSAAPRIG